MENKRAKKKKKKRRTQFTKKNSNRQSEKIERDCHIPGSAPPVRSKKPIPTNSYGDSNPKHPKPEIQIPKPKSFSRESSTFESAKALLATMGIMGSSFSFILGSVFGIYVAQNYNVPNIQKLSTTGLLIAKHIEETYRKPKKRDDENQNQ
ncbi:hypothetical protein GBA52_015886 [Prunus armeniaca]|nr:hypothetical protein GBA52_015886 [Prunus armeniaca]